MKTLKTFATVAFLTVCSLAQAKGSSHSVSDGFVPKIGQACMVAITTAKTNRFINVNMLRFIEVEENNPTIMVVSYVGNHYQETNMKISYNSKEEAKEALNKLMTTINNCGQ